MKRLYDLTPAEVSLVGKGANKKKFLIFKSDKGNKSMPQADQEIRNLVNAVSPQTMAKVEKILKTMKVKKADGDMAPKKDSAVFKETHNVTHDGESDRAPLSDRAQAALKAVARILAPFKDEISDDHLDAVQQEVGIAGEEPAHKGDDGEGGGDEGHEHIQMDVAYPEGVEEEHHIGALNSAKKAYMSHMEKMGYRKYPDEQMAQKNKHGIVEDSEEGDDDDDEGEEVGKTAVKKSAIDLSAFQPNQRAQLEMIFKSNTELAEQNKELVKKNATLETEIKAERDSRLLKDFEERAKGFKHLSANSGELAVVMKSMSEKDPEGLKKMEAVLKAADAQIALGADLFSERGSRQSGGNLNDADAQLERLVDSVVQKSDGSKTREMIYEEVLKTKEGKRLMAETIRTSAGVK